MHTHTRALRFSGAFAVQRATLQPGGQRCSRASSMVCCGLHRKGTGAYLTGGRHVWNPRLPQEMGGKGEEGRRESKRLTVTCDMKGNLTPL